jgi:hypothetical protein
MRDTFLRLLIPDERNHLYLKLDEDTEAEYRAKIILLKDDGYTVPEIRRATNHHDSNIIIHRFNEKGLDGIVSMIHEHKQANQNNQQKYRKKDC